MGAAKEEDATDGQDTISTLLQAKHPVLKPADALTAPGMKKKPLGRASMGSPTANGGQASPAMLAGWRRSTALASASFGHGALGSAGVGQTGLTILGEPKTPDKP